jgi:hypothetical protein
MGEEERQFWTCCVGALIFVIGLEWWIRGLAWASGKIINRRVK